MTRHKAGDQPGQGYYTCAKCGRVFYLDRDDSVLPTCPVCHGSAWEKLT